MNHKHEIIILAAVSDNGIIGNHGKIPWKISKDMERFMYLTKNHPVILGRRTFESILTKLGHPLPNRQNIIVTSEEGYQSHGEIIIAKSLDEAIHRASEFVPPTFVCGGQRIYAEALPRADKMYLTRVHKDYEGDTSFPSINENEWKLTNRQDFPETEATPAYSYLDYKRRTI